MDSLYSFLHFDLSGGEVLVPLLVPGDGLRRDRGLDLRQRRVEVALKQRLLLGLQEPSLLHLHTNTRNPSKHISTSK